MLKSGTEGLISGQPILQAEGQFVACHFSPSEYVPFRKIGRRELKEILRKAADKQDSFKVGHYIWQYTFVDFARITGPLCGN